MTTRILLYEFVTGGGWWSIDPKQHPAGSLLAEGRAMIRAVAEDFASLPEVEVITSRDVRLAELHPRDCRVHVIEGATAELDWLARQSADADWTLLVAPETSGALWQRCRLVEAAGGRLLSPRSEVVALASDKQRTAEWLALHAVPVVRGKLLDHRADDFVFPAVVKPVDGCGSLGVRLLRSPADIEAQRTPTPRRIEEFVRGIAASVAVLCGPSGCFPLPPCDQRLSSDGSFTYLGGGLPLAPALAARAIRLAVAAVQTLPQPLGYVGVDLVLGEAVDGAGDRVIEINPRLTTSYVGLRALAEANLAAAMLAVADGAAPDLRFGNRAIEFTAAGTIAS